MLKRVFLYLIIICVFAWGQSPGDSIGTTWYDMQSNHSYGQRLFVDAYNNVHINWMKMDQGQTERFCAWNFRSSGGGYFGETQASPSWSGWVQLDVMRDGSERTIIAYHYYDGIGYYSWIDIDSANGAGNWPNDPKALQIDDYLWPKITVCNNNNILMATGKQPSSSNLHHVFLTTDLGDTWNEFAAFDSCSMLTFFLRASRKSGSNKVVYVHTRFITDTVSAGQLDQDVWYMLSYDNGETWTPLINLTEYQPYPIDSVRAYCDVNAVFDGNDDLHIVWAGRRVDSAGYYGKSKIFHWDELNDTITVINSPSIYYSEPGGWWTSPYYFGSFHMPADRPELIMDTISDYVYCIWHGNDDHSDTSGAGWPNGELFGSFSTDNGITWADYVNLTNTRSPGAPPGQCLDEDYGTVHPYVIDDSIYVTYIEDKDAGNCMDAEGIRTSNPIRCWVFHKNLITGIEEETSEAVGNYDFGPTIFSGPLVLPRHKNCKVFDITGRVVLADKIKPGIYFIEVNEKVIQKVIKVR